MNFPSGTKVDSVGTYNDIVYVSLPASGKLHLIDVEYLGLMVEFLSLSGLAISVGEFTTFIPVAALTDFREKRTTVQEFVERWKGVKWVK